MNLSQERIYGLVVKAVQYGFWYAQNSQHDGKDVPLGNIEQWLMSELGFKTKTELDFFRGVKERFETGDDIVCYQKWFEEDGEWVTSGWINGITEEYIYEPAWDLVGILDTDKHGHPIKAIFKKTR